MQHLIVKYTNVPSTFNEVCYLPTTVACPLWDFSSFHLCSQTDFLNHLEFYLLDLKILTADDTLSIEMTGDTSALAVVVKEGGARVALARSTSVCFLSMWSLTTFFVSFQILFKQRLQLNSTRSCMETKSLKHQLSSCRKELISFVDQCACCPQGLTMSRFHVLRPQSPVLSWYVSCSYHYCQRTKLLTWT